MLPLSAASLGAFQAGSLGYTYNIKVVIYQCIAPLLPPLPVNERTEADNHFGLRMGYTRDTQGSELRPMVWSRSVYPAVYPKSPCLSDSA